MGQGSKSKTVFKLPVLWPLRSWDSKTCFVLKGPEAKVGTFT